jgi:hypothetical protein
MIERRLEEISRIAPPNVFVSIDYKNKVLSEEMKSILEKYQFIWPPDSSLNYRIHTKNQGLVTHITETISEFLEHYDCAVVIEDDISISKAFYESAIVYMESKLLRSRYASFGGFSLFPKIGLLEGVNTFRPTPYFACWGWVVAKENWIGYRADLNGEDIPHNLFQSKVWNNLDSKQRGTWKRRFEKAKLNPYNTWDVQFQYHTFKIDKLNLVPFMRLVDNEGFSDLRGTHTQFARPRALGKFKFANKAIHVFILPIWVSKFLVYLESRIFFEDISIHPQLKKIVRILLNR